jgi:hypothetical protein
MRALSLKLHPHSKVRQHVEKPPILNFHPQLIQDTQRAVVNEFRLRGGHQIISVASSIHESTTPKPIYRLSIFETKT